MTDGDGALRGSLAVLGVVAIAVGLASVLAATTGILPDQIAIESWLSTSVVALLVLFVGAFAFLYGRSGRSDTARRPLTDAAPATATVPSRLGEQLEKRLDAPDAAGVRTELRTAAITVLELRTGCSRTMAAERLLDGSWTDDRIAAATLGGDAGPSFRPEERVLAWLLPRRTLRYRAERTASAIEAIEPGDVEGTPDREDAVADDAEHDRSALADSIADGTTVGNGRHPGGATVEDGTAQPRRAETEETAAVRAMDASESQSRRSVTETEDWVTEEASDRVEGSLDA